jgi:hypothetical protein
MSEELRDRTASSARLGVLRLNSMTVGIVNLTPDKTELATQAR